VEVEGINSDISQEILQGMGRKKDSRKKDPMFQACLERVCNRVRLDDFYVDTGRGYYGEEVNGIYLERYTPLEDFLKLEKPHEWVEHYLTQEYGHVLDELKGREWELVKLPVKDIKVPKAYRKLDREAIQTYVESYGVEYLPGPTCLTREDNSLVDGYHRYTAAVEAGKRKMEVIRPKAEQRRT